MPRIIYEIQEKYISSFAENDDELILSIEEYAKQNSVPILDKNASQFLELIIKSYQPKRVLEIGTAIGYSSIKIARSLDKKGILHTIEISENNIQLANENILKSGLSKKIKIFKGEAKEIIPDLKKKYNLIFLDADKEDYLELLELSIPKLKNNGIIIVDNLLWHGWVAKTRVIKKYKRSTEFIREFNNIFMNHPKLFATILTIGDGIGIAVKKKND
ncbi:MAG: O-methyltransferase [Chlorobiaceae bacterium]|nr:O-methyltransferase [Chlorobiaceae bacterium]MBA4310990.1 O-methyltransferase [Chlorobiaceae bacterium]